MKNDRGEVLEGAPLRYAPENELGSCSYSPIWQSVGALGLMKSILVFLTASHTRRLTVKRNGSGLNLNTNPGTSRLRDIQPRNAIASYVGNIIGLKPQNTCR